MGTGRLLWTLRRPFFYGVVVLIVSLLFLKVKFTDLWNGAFAGSNFNLFYAYLVWSVPGLILMLVISIIVVKKFYDEDSALVGFIRFTFEDIVSPIYNIFQFVGGFIASKLGNDVNWPGCIWDVIWTLIWGGFIFWGLATQI